MDPLDSDIRSIYSSPTRNCHAFAKNCTQEIFLRKKNESANGRRDGGSSRRLELEPKLWVVGDLHGKIKVFKF